ncbi:hypothetical protein EI555_015481 [Monodon monoceros]|uniref:Large ribosomal subunit protein P1 n=1 Tax=Monodon monoceros TaxID=40151 RepID=A0A4U1FHX1_MONMO|nr:hypothetical protein EI555_015481 [Monodon monoceros]
MSLGLAGDDDNDDDNDDDDDNESKRVVVMNWWQLQLRDQVGGIAILTSMEELAYIYLALILHDDEVTVTEDKINALIKAAKVNVKPFWPGLFAKALASVNIGSLICNVGTGGPAPAAGATPAGGPAPSPTAAPAEEKKVEAKNEESEESDDMGFGLFD